jgi:hypothetical protein
MTAVRIASWAGIAAVGSTVVVGTLACDRSGLELLPQPIVEDLPAVVEIGHIEVLDSPSYTALMEETRALATPVAVGLADDSPPWAWCNQPGSNGEDYRCYYGQVGAPDGVNRGGATFTFTGTGGDVCVMVDPESVFWAPSIEPNDLDYEYTYPDSYPDDGDLDLYAGLSSYYTGSPGIEMGDFTGYYTDSLGNAIEIEYGACFQYGFQSVIDYAHSGRGTVEFCTIDTNQREGIEYTVVLDTFAVPLDDGAVSFGVVVAEGDCASAYAPNECTITGESLDSKVLDEAVKAGTTDFELRACSDKLESAFCDDDMLSYCCINPEMCGPHPEYGTCDYFWENAALEGWTTRDAYCSANPARCCD